MAIDAKWLILIVVIIALGYFFGYRSGKNKALKDNQRDSENDD